MKNSRVLKFRAWDKTQDHMIASDELIFHEYTDVEDHFCDEDLDFMQYTGLKDKNGKEIYSGDILDLHSTVNGVNLFEVYYSESQARFSIKYYTNRMPKRSLEYEYSVSDFFKPCEFSGEVDYEVIGNIYEHKHLLESENA